MNLDRVFGATENRADIGVGFSLRNPQQHFGFARREPKGFERVWRNRSWASFTPFILENLRNLGALKAMGTSDSTLARMIMLQTITVGLIGYGCSVGLATLFGSLCLEKGMAPFYLP